MGKTKRVDASLKGKKPVNTAQKRHTITRNPSHIRNKLKRSQMYGKFLEQKRVHKHHQKQQEEELGQDVVKPVPRTIDNTRELEPTMVMDNDAEIAADQADDEFAPYLTGSRPAKILITTRPRPSANVFYFVADLQKCIPNCHYYPRKSYSVKEICQFASNRDFTHLIVLSEKSKQCNGLTISHLAKHDGIGTAGPTAHFKVSGLQTRGDIPQAGCATSHTSELNLHGFGTRLGHRVGRLLGSLFPTPQFQGRQVVTFHNQRDYIFCRHHRYIFKENNDKKKPKATSDDKEAPLPPAKAKLQELGPRFTLKLRWLQEGTFDTMHGEYEWFHKRKEMDTTRRKFHL